jgi:hypothetical protein
MSRVLRSVISRRLSKAVRGHWPLEGSNPSPPPLTETASLSGYAPTACTFRGAFGAWEVEVGEPKRTYTVEPVEDPVPREVPSEPAVEPSEDPAEPEEVEAE